MYEEFVILGLAPSWVFHVIKVRPPIPKRGVVTICLPKVVDFCVRRVFLFFFFIDKFLVLWAGHGPPSITSHLAVKHAYFTLLRCIQPLS
jgi:hypothetical protein